jgi:hypothetical protein
MKSLEKRLEREDLLKKMEVDELQHQNDVLGKQLLERNQDVTTMEEKSIEVCCCPFTFPVSWTSTPLTFLEKLKCLQDTKNAEEKATKEVLDQAAKKRRKSWKEKRRRVAREADKGRKDTRDAIAAQQVSLRGETTRQDNTRKVKRRLRQETTRP